MKGFQKALQEYESKMFAPFDNERMTEDEYIEAENRLHDEAESLNEERWLKENDRQRTDNN